MIEVYALLLNFFKVLLLWMLFIMAFATTFYMIMDEVGVQLGKHNTCGLLSRFKFRFRPSFPNVYDVFYSFSLEEGDFYIRFRPFAVHTLTNKTMKYTPKMAFAALHT